MSEDPSNMMHTMRSELRRDMHTMIRTMMQPPVEQQQFGSPMMQPVSYQSIPVMVPGQQMPQVQMQEAPQRSNWMLAFLLGCAISCVALSWLGLIIFGLLRYGKS